MNAEKIIKSPKLKKVVIILGIVLIVLASFAVGVGVGIHKTRFSSKFGENYERNFVGKHGGPMGGPMNGPMGFFREMEGRDFRNGHGLAGTVVSVSENSLAIKDKDNKESTVTVSDKTIIKIGRDEIKIGDLKQDENVVVIGKPGDNGTVNADFIRVFDNNSTEPQN